MAKRVAIIGQAFRFPGTHNENYWQDLLEGKDLITKVDSSRWSNDAYLHPGKEHPGTAYTHAAGSLGDVSGFDADFFGISPREAALMDPQQRLLLEMSWEAMEEANIKPSSLRGSDCGVYIGISSVDYAYRIAEDLGAIDAATATGNTSSIAANRLSYFFDLHGPSIALDTACSSSLVAFHQACRAIQSGECTHALTGGISLHLHPYGFIIFSKASMLSRQGHCNVFDASGDGYVRSEGGGIFLLKDYDQAVADGDRILAVVAGSAVNTDGRKAGLTVPSADAQADLMRGAYAQAGIAPRDLDYLEAHGTGTAVGDPIETRAIGVALGKRRPASKPLPIGSVKSNMGHLEPASGVAGMVKAIHALRHRVVPATIGIRNPNPNIAFKDWNIEIVTQNLPLKSQGTLYIGVNSFGFGGANAHVILESAPTTTQTTATKLVRKAPVPLIVTGKSHQALQQAAAALANQLRDAPSLYDIAYHAALRRDWHQERALVFASDNAVAAEDLQSLADGNPSKHRVSTACATVQDARGPVFVYSGNGSQWAGMGQRLMTDPVFAAAVHEVDALFAGYSDFSPSAELAQSSGNDRFDYTEIAQPTLFALQIGITRMLAQRGVKPVAVIGHSVGEVAAVWACGALSLPDAVKVIYHRSRLQGLTKGKGGMTAVGISGDETQALITELGLNKLEIAGTSSHRGATVAGDPAQLETIEAVLAERNVFHRRLTLDYAFHSNAMDPIENDIVQSLAELGPRDADIPFYSTVSGGLEAGRRLDAAYWWRNVRLPVQFEAASAAAIDDGLSVFVEIGPHPVLRSYLKDAMDSANRPGHVLITASRGADDPEKIYDTAGQIILSGAQIDWQALFPWKGEHTTLPAYPWQRERHWHSVTPESPGWLMRQRVHPLLGFEQGQHAGIWETRLDTQSHPNLADHVVGDAIVFPGTGFAELALAAAQQWHTGEYIDIEEIDIQAPLILANAPSKIVRLELDGQDGRFTIQAREQGSQEPWTPHASGRILQQPNGVPLRDLEPLRLPPRKPDFSGGDHTALTHAVGLAYGPAFRAVAHGWNESDTSVVAALQPDACLDAELESAVLHPALLDSAFQLIIQLLKNDPALSQGVAFVPVKIGRLTLRAGRGQPKYARARLHRRAPHSLTADFELFDHDGQVLAYVRQVRFRSIRLQKTGNTHLDFIDCLLTPQPHPLAPTPANPILTDALVCDLQHLAQQWRHENTDRFSQEVDPLLESLCDRQALEALRAQAPDGVKLSKAAVARRARGQPQIAALFEQTLARTLAAGLAEASPAGWTLRRDEDDEPNATDIWNSLLREYPDYFPAIFAAGCVGLHLPRRLQGSVDFDGAAPQTVTPAAISRLILGAERGQRLVSVLTQLLHKAAQHRQAGHRLAVLEIGQGLPLIGPACRTALDVNVVDYRYATPDHQSLENARHSLLDSYPEAGLALIGDEAAAPDAQRHDLVVLHAEFDDLQTSHRALRFARASLKPGGKLLLRGMHPSPWVDFIFGGQSAWWRKDTDPPLSALPPAACWQQWLCEHGLSVEGPIDFTPDATSGPYLIVASASEAISAIPAVEPRRLLLLAGTADADLALARQLHNHLQSAGQHSTLHSDATASQLEALIVEASGRREPVHDIVLADGWGAPDRDAAAQLQQQVRRCALAATLVQVCERTHTAATLWLLTRNGAVPLGGGNPKDERLADAALWGYGRTLANEVSNYRVRIVDLPGSIRSVNALAHEILYPDTEDEIVIGAEGERHVPRLRIVARPTPAGTQQPDDRRQAYRLGFEFPGQLRNLRWQSYDAPDPADDQIEVHIHATGLNFRDVMYALGLLSDEAIEDGFAGPTLGLEFSGVVTRVGACVTDYRPGDNVVGFGPASFSDRALTRSSAISPIPPGISFEAAATIPSTFFTVYYALHQLARLEEGEKILIHGGAGGVGIAAIQFAQSIGAEIYATAGSDEKRDFLRMMGVAHIYDSRSLSYSDEILADTHGAGVDVVLNSLAGEAINRNLQVLRPFGRFLELGKRDFYENTRIGLRPFRNNISYFGIDADQLMSERPALTCRLFREMMQLFSEGALHPLPYSVFDANDVIDAFRYMQQARQIGKIVVTYRNGIHLRHHAHAPRRQKLLLPENATYLVTGGLGGFGLRTAQWLAEKGARHLVLISRSGPSADSARAAITHLEAAGVRVYAAACDVTDGAALNKLLDTVARDMPPLRGIVHAAVVIDDGLARNATAAQIERTLSAKVLGAYRLHTLTRQLPLDFCVYFSSATTLFGNPGQSNYVAANHWLEALAAHRLALGLPATCVRWGAIDDVGFLARNEKIKDALQGRMGGSAISSAVALQALEDMLLAKASGLGVLELDWSALARFLSSANAPKFGMLTRHSSNTGENDEQDQDIAHLLATLNPAALHSTFSDMLKAEIGEILRVPADRIDPERSIYDMGLDSLMGVELIVALENRFGIRLPVMALSESPTVNKLTARLIELLRGDIGAPPIDRVTFTVEKLVADHAVEVSETSINTFIEEIKTGDNTPPRRMIQ